jgi:hypothetical protein
MRRRPLDRAFAALLLVWFAIVLAEPAALHACPMHDAPPQASDAGHSHSHQAPAPRDQHRGCTCIGDCSAGGSVAGVPPRSVHLADAPVRCHPAALPPAISPAITAPAFLLPYANGPPGGRHVA